MQLLGTMADDLFATKLGPTMSLVRTKPVKLKIPCWLGPQAACVP